jgi:hypothetical protein
MMVKSGTRENKLTPGRPREYAVDWTCRDDAGPAEEALAVFSSGPPRAVGGWTSSDIPKLRGHISGKRKVNSSITKGAKRMRRASITLSADLKI